jgi:hypothetical protein
MDGKLAGQKLPAPEGMSYTQYWVIPESELHVIGRAQGMRQCPQCGVREGDVYAEEHAQAMLTPRPDVVGQPAKFYTNDADEDEDDWRRKTHRRCKICTGQRRGNTPRQPAKPKFHPRDPAHMPPGHISAEAAMQRLGIQHRQQLHLFVRQGKLRRVQINGKTFGYNEKDIAELVAERAPVEQPSRT